MCVIVHQPVVGNIDKETCRKLWKENPDGGGFAFVDDDNQVVVKKAMDFSTFWSMFEQARSAYPQRDFLLHMRIATHGSVKIENVHPFVVDDDTVMAHNGIIHGVPDYKDDRTDTEVFITDVLPELPDGWQDQFYLSSMVEDWIGWSKLLFLTTSPDLERNVYRLGDWQRHEGLWLSNLNGLFRDVPIVQGMLPAPRPSSYSETTENWQEWYDHQNTAAYSDWEIDLYRAEVVAERKTMEINHPLIEVGSDFECYGCNTVVDHQTAECACWDVVCGACWKFVALCSIKGGCLGSTHFDYTSLSAVNKKLVDGLDTRLGNKSNVYQIF